MNCNTCNIAAPQYELFDGLCGKCLLAAHQRTLVELEKSQIERMNLEEQVEVIGCHAAAMRDAITSTINGLTLPDYLNQQFPSTRGHAPLKQHLQRIGASIQDDAGRNYVHKDQVKPLVDVLDVIWRQSLIADGKNIIGIKLDWLRAKSKEGIDHARTLGLLEDK